MSTYARALASAVLAMLPAALSVAVPPAHRYVDPAQAALPMPYYSLERQPWRSYLEVTPATTFLNGLGVVWAPLPPGKSEEQVVAELARAGFRRVRVEFPWGAMRWDEQGMQADAALHLSALLRAMKKHQLRPLVLLNANHGAPGPMNVTQFRLAAPAAAGSRTIQLEGATGELQLLHSVVFTLADSGHAGPLVTAIAPDGRTVTLSRPVPANLGAGAALRIGRMKYLPLYPVGTPEFRDTAAAWVHYVDYVIGFVTAGYGADFDVEVWNELTFGSDFLDINLYFDRPAVTPGPDFLHRGGAAWELGRLTAAEIARRDPRPHSMWGFSNTTFFHTSVTDLPPLFSGQSYHPYGIGPRCYAQSIAQRQQYNVGGFVPAGCAQIPEGWAQTFQQTESLIRLINPRARLAHPEGVTSFAHYITEHGFEPSGLGITTGDAAERAKEKFLLRAPLFWLNKGLSGLYVFNAYDPDDLKFGMLNSRGEQSAATLALQRLVARFHGAMDSPAARGVQATVVRSGGDIGVYPNDPAGDHVTQADTVVILPFQVTDRKMIAAVYIMTENFPESLPGQSYEITLGGIDGRNAHVEFYDPLEDSLQPVRNLSSEKDAVHVQLQLTDSPRLLEVSL